MTTNHPRRARNRRVMRGLASVLVGILLATTLAVGVGVRPAYGLDLCKDAPAPVGPKSGMAGLVTLRPQQVPTVDPFADPRVPIADVYGYTWSWTVFDLGCTPDALSDPQAVFNTANANLILGFANTGMAGLGLVERFAKDTGIGWFSAWVGQLATAIEPMILGGATPNGVMVGLLPMACIALGVLLVWRARRARYQATAKAVLMLVICIGLATWTLLFPVGASATVDAGIRQVATVSGGAFNASLADGANRQALYRAWLAGQFGDPDSRLAKEYGPKVLAATRYTWGEWDQIERDPAARESLDEAKAKAYKEIAEEVKKQNPGAYLTFQGRGDRVGTAIFGLLVGFVMGIFALIAYFMILLGRAMMQVLVVIVPVGAVVGVLPPGYGVLMRLWGLFTAAVWAVAKFTFGAGVMATILGLLATLDPISSVLWMTVVTVIAFFILRPAREFKRLIPGLDPDRNYLAEGLEKAIRAGVQLAGAAATGGISGAVGGAVAGSTIANQQPTPPAAPSQGMARVELTPLVQAERPPLPAPQWAQVPGTHKHVALEPGSGTPTPQSGSRRWDGVLDASSVRLALPPGSTTSTRPEQPAQTTTATPPTASSSSAIEAAPPTTVLREVVTITQRPDNTGISDPSGAVVLEGEVLGVEDHSTYRRQPTAGQPPQDIVDAEVVDAVDRSAERDRGSDQPSSELLLYQSGRNRT